ncbi:hypothetical protein ANANG_G00101760 [Anguilla anguilla]|uniref:Uncharacterized protein n=1 Tax=Anguilla anguilla TaxID=7936 RepID=A0A9D3MLZ0_ANGAN|nr:hypothetical protein ANANG_G00101760 [Anguilla anguilla]
MVHRILASCKVRCATQNLVDLEGYRPEEQSWVPTRDIVDPLLICNFHQWCLWVMSEGCPVTALVPDCQSLPASQSKFSPAFCAFPVFRVHTYLLIFSNCLHVFHYEFKFLVFFSLVFMFYCMVALATSTPFLILLASHVLCLVCLVFC